MTLVARLVLTSIGLISLTAMVLGSLTYQYVGTAIIAFELAATLAIIVLAIALVRAAARPPAEIAEVVRQLVGDLPATEPNLASDNDGILLQRFAGIWNILHGKAVRFALGLRKGRSDEATLEADRICIAVVKSAHCPINTKKPDGTITGWNLAAEQLYQFTAQEAVCSNISIVVPPEHLKEHLSIFAKALREGRVENFETFRVAKNGRRIDISLCLSSGISPLGEANGASVARDISEEKFTARKFQFAFETFSSSMVMVDGDGLIAMVNAEAERMFGYRREKLIGQRIEILIPERLNSLVASNPTSSVKPIEVRNSAPSSDLFGRRQDGTEFPIEVNLKTIHQNKSYVGLCLIVDVTERKRLERLKDEFVATVSHELRTPMTSIFASLSLLNSGAAGKMPATAARLLAISHANCERLVRLINDILDVQRLEAGQSIFRLERINVRSLVEKTVDTLRGFARDHGVSLRLDVASKDCPVSADPDRLAQVVTNLLSNAIKFSPIDTEVLIGVERRNETVAIVVRDHGPGIPSEFKKRIFEKFAQADATDSRNKSGTGLGLSIVKQIVERLDGRVGFRDAPGGGTIFYVALPYWGSKTGADGEISSLLESNMPVVRAIKAETA